ncbi:UDP-N-acetylmuramoyl-tripeptide--D-alanyl-D-alanine ligase [Patescibacteria group bacterium]|nr:UDP-N-acetylmuramoyl-tripeptide--D-alanyl-D-alanine ligase [Patescibacteria group bacterium]
MLLKILQKFLAFLSKRIIKKYKPLVVGITGSVGKSSTKKAIALVLKSQLNIRQSKGNYNNEIGVPLTILGVKSPGRNIFGWIRVFILGFLKIIFKQKSYPKILVLEMAADRPGDIEYLVDIAPCHIGVITSISAAHTEFFKTLDKVAMEKHMIIKNLQKDGWAILNADNKRTYALKNKTSAQVLSYGLDTQANVQGLEVQINQELKEDRLKIKGLKFKVRYHGNVVPVFLPNIISLAQVNSVLAAISVGLALDLNLIDIVQALKAYEPLPGRMVLLPGVNNSLIIDDTYNSSPQAVESALDTLEAIIPVSLARKWVILGDMLELGDLSEKMHREIGEKIIQTDVDYLITVGKQAQYIAQQAREKGFNQEGIFSFDNALGVVPLLKPRIKNGDIILVKGSQAARMERIVKNIMLRPYLAKKYLVRQSRGWLKQ